MALVSVSPARETDHRSGDPGEGKTTFVLAVIAALTRGEALPESEQALEPLNVIYQTAEDGLADTINHGWTPPARTVPGCVVIDESQRELDLCDQRLEQAVQQTKAQLIVLDPSRHTWGTVWTCTGPTRCVPF